MRVVIQRVKEASVKVAHQSIGQIGPGLLVFLAVHQEDTEQELQWMVRKVSQLRIFDDQNGKMNLSAEEVNAQILVVSQFTLYGDCEKGRRPSFDQAADPQKGESFYLKFVEALRQLSFKVETGQFRAMMDVTLINDGPVTFVIERDFKKRENFGGSV